MANSLTLSIVLPATPEQVYTAWLSTEKQGGTRLTLDHTNIPAGQADDYRQGWEDFYFGPLAAYFAR